MGDAGLFDAAVHFLVMHAGDAEDHLDPARFQHVADLRAKGANHLVRLVIHRVFPPFCPRPRHGIRGAFALSFQFRQKDGSSSTRTDTTSSRPTSIATIISHFAASGKSSMAPVGPTPGPKAGPIL